VPYLGNDLQVAQPSYRNIDDISGSFNSSTTSFPLLVSGAAPVPFPINSNQCLISVAGVVQRPDDSGTEGFRISGGNIIFSSAPSTGADFFGVILAGADYVNVGANFPSGSAAVPSITFDSDLDTGIYNSGANQVSITTAGTERLRITSAGNVGIGTTTPESFGQLAVRGATTIATWGNTSAHFSDAATGSLYVSHSSNRVSLKTDSDLDLFCSNSGDSVIFSTSATERARVDGSGRLLVGTPSSRSQSGVSALLQVEGTSNTGSISAINNTANSGGSYILLGKTRGGSVGSTTAVTAGDTLGAVYFHGADGTGLITAASIEAYVDGTPGTNDMPGRLTFSVTADGASSLTERMRITSNGYLKASNTGNYYSATSAFHEVVSSLNAATLIVQNSSASLTNSVNGVYVYYAGAAPNNTTAAAFYFEDTAGLRASIRSNGGLANYQANNVNFSDRNVKKNITVADDTWNCVKQWEIVKYHYKDQPDEADLSLGVIAQQVAESCPEVITVFQEAKEATEDAPAQEERLGVKEQQMMWMAIKALQAAQVRIEALEADVAQLKGA
jgi:hypothetical protein